MISEQPQRRPEVKICGLTSVADARLAVALGASFVGVNFYPPSPRALDIEQARRIRDAVAEDARVVGVFVNRRVDEVAEIAEKAALDLLQFHGEEEVAELLPFAPRAIRAFRQGPELDPSALDLYHGFWGLLFDAPHQRLYGGTGQSWDYSQIGEWSLARRAFVAGGISPENVGALLHALPGIFGVDVCSGVESTPGVKDERLLRRLFAEIERTLES